MKPTNAVLLQAVIVWNLLSENVHGQFSPVVIHSGASNPTNEGFTLTRDGNPALTSVFGDQGRNAWSTHASSLSDISQYSYNLSAQQQADVANGWMLSLTVRVLQPFNQPSFGIFGSFSTATETFSLLLGAQPSGDPTVQLGNTQYILTGGGSGYHNYELIYNLNSSSASLWIDGTERLAGLTGGHTTSGVRFFWGLGQNPYGNLTANWNAASFSIIPEPSSLALCLTGGILAAHGFIRCRKTGTQ